MLSFQSFRKNEIVIPVLLSFIAVFLSIVIARGRISPSLLIYAMLGLLGTVFVNRLKLWVFVVVLMFPVRDLALFTIGRANIRIGDVAILMALVWLVLQIEMRPTLWRILRNQLTKLLIFFVLAVFISSFWSYSFSYSLIRTIKLARAFFIFFFLATALTYDWKRYSGQLLLGIAVGMLALNATWVYSAVQGGGIEVLQEFDELTSKTIPTEFRNTGRGLLATFGAKTVALYVFFLIAYIPFIKSKLTNSVIILLFLSGLFVVVGSLFRSLMIGVFAGFLLIVLWSLFSNQRSLFRIGSFVLVGLIAFNFFAYATGLFQLILMRFSSAFNLSDGSVTLRLAFSQQLLSWWSANYATMIFGIGPDSFIARTTYYVHNLYVQILGEQGISGFLIFLAIQVVTFVEFFKGYRLVGICKDDKARWLLVVLISAHISYMIISLAGSDFTEFNYWITSSVIVAIHVYYRNVINKKFELLPNTPQT